MDKHVAAGIETFNVRVLFDEQSLGIRCGQLQQVSRLRIVFQVELTYRRPALTNQLLCL